MKNMTLTIDVQITQIAGQAMPKGDQIMHRIIEHLYDLMIEDSAVVDGVHVKMIDGQTTNLQDQ